jgi:large-conductance mechanosensitive channel
MRDRINYMIYEYVIYFMLINLIEKIHWKKSEEEKFLETNKHKKRRFIT